MINRGLRLGNLRLWPPQDHPTFWSIRKEDAPDLVDVVERGDPYGDRNWSCVTTNRRAVRVVSRPLREQSTKVPLKADDGLGHER